MEFKPKSGGYSIGLSTEQINELLCKKRITIDLAVYKNEAVELERMSLYLASSKATDKIERYYLRASLQPKLFSNRGSYYAGEGLILKIEDHYHDLCIVDWMFKNMKSEIIAHGVAIQLKNMDRRASDINIFIYHKK